MTGTNEGNLGGEASRPRRGRREAAGKSEMPGNASTEVRTQILLAALELMGAQRALNLSLRTVAGKVGVGPSLVAYHFSTRGRLIAAACDLALSDFSEHLDALPRLAALARGPADLAEVAGNWLLATAQRHPELARIWGDLLLGAKGAPELLEVARVSMAAWRHAWAQLTDSPILAEFAAFEFIFAGALAGVPEYEIMTREAFRRMLARCFGGEVLDRDRHWHGALFQERMAPLSTRAPADATTRHRIIEAAADLIGAEGTIAATHRAVAAKAGASLSSMTHHFNSRAELVREGLLRVFERALGLHPASSSAATQPMTVEKMALRAGRDLDGQVGERLGMIRAIAEVAQEASLDPSFQPTAAELRSIRGLITRGVLASLLPREGGIHASDAADFAVWESGAALLRDIALRAPADAVRDIRGAVLLFFPPKP